MVARMRAGWRGALREGSPCGTGTLRRHTENIRQWIPGLLREHAIRTVCDAGAGDMSWAREAFAGVAYRPFDLVPRSPAVTELDICETPLPDCDLIVCRHVLIHLDPPRIEQALRLFKTSGQYVLASQYDGTHWYDPERQFNRTNLRGALGAPVASVQDGEEAQCSLALWRL